MHQNVFMQVTCEQNCPLIMFANLTENVLAENYEIKKMNVQEMHKVLKQKL